MLIKIYQVQYQFYLFTAGYCLGEHVLLLLVLFDHLVRLLKSFSLIFLGFLLSFSGVKVRSLGLADVLFLAPPIAIIEAHYNNC